MGTDAPLAHRDERPAREVFLGTFEIQRHEVTNHEYRAYCDRTGRDYPADPTWEVGYFLTKPDHPVVNVSWEEASDYCRWLGRVLGKSVQLPSEAQWEKAARGTSVRLYPWGDADPFDGRRALCNFQAGQGGRADGFPYTAPVGSFLGGASPYGVEDLAGNVWEWTGDPYPPDYLARPSDRRRGSPFRVIRGGSWDSREDRLRVTYRGGARPTYRSSDLGFRCACTPESR
jgi:formylglycine-generating enzyme required for sulfatase activity